MGASSSCTVTSKASPGITKTESQDSLYAQPEAMDNIMGIDIDRSSPQFQETLKLTTELIIQYRDAIYPLLKLPLDMFADSRYLEFREICGEIHNDLVFEEKDTPNEKFQDDLDMKVKDSISSLAKHYTTMSLNVNQAVTMHFEDYYDDTLKVIITDIERKQFWRKEHRQPKIQTLLLPL